MSVDDGDSGVLPGWYPDPANTERLRRWDGKRWTRDVVASSPDEAVEPAAPGVPPEAPAPVPDAPAPAPPPSPEPPPAAEPPPVAQPTPPAAPAPAEPIAPASPAPTPPPSPATPAPTPPPSPTMATPAAPPARPAPVDGKGTGSDAKSEDLPDWANLPGLTLPPDLSSLDGGEGNSVLSRPTFEDPLELTGPSWQPAPILAPPTFEQTPDEPAEPEPERPAPNLPPPTAPQRSRTPGSERYAPPPSGGQYNVPPPPGAPHMPTPGMLPPSSLVSPGIAASAWSSPPPVSSAVEAPVLPPVGYEKPQPSSAPRSDAEPLKGSVTIWVWLIALLPLIQFAGVYLAFAELNVAFVPGLQWAILAAPAVFALLFAIGDRRRLTAMGAARPPSPLLAIVPPIYLLTRAIEIGRSSIAPLIAWIVFQVAAAAGVYYLLPHLLNVVLRTIE